MTKSLITPQLFEHFKTLSETTSKTDLSLDDFRSFPFSFDSLDTFYLAYFKQRLYQLTHHRRLDMNEVHYDKNFFEKLKLILKDGIDFFLKLDPSWVNYLLSHDELRLCVEALFTEENAEFALVSFFIELSQTQGHITASIDSDDLSLKVHQALYQKIQSSAFKNSDADTLIDEILSPYLCK